MLIFFNYFYIFKINLTAKKFKAYDLKKKKDQLRTLYFGLFNRKKRNMRHESET